MQLILLQVSRCSGEDRLLDHPSCKSIEQVRRCGEQNLVVNPIGTKLPTCQLLPAPSAPDLLTKAFTQPLTQPRCVWSRSPRLTASRALASKSGKRVICGSISALLPGSGPRPYTIP